MKTFCLVAALYCLPFVSNAFSTKFIIPKVENLASSSTWLKLLHFDERTKTSAISSADFFLTNDADINPKTELIAFLEVLLHGDGTIQCQFPARAIWLKQQLPEQLSSVNYAHCDEFNEWSLSGETHSLSVVYATGFLGNPASFYGHTFLKLNSSNGNARTSLIDVSVNYGALVPDNENPVSYILKGIMGGYEGAFSHIQYFHHNHNYGEAELRDLWEYELNLTQWQVDFLLAHIWEVLGKKYTYYFFKENCAYRMAELLELIEGVDILPNNLVWTMPQVLMQKMANATLNERPLVRKIAYEPSRQSRFYTAYNRLTQNEKAWIDTFIDQVSNFDSPSFSKFGLEERRSIVDTLLHYFQYLRAGLDETDRELEKLYQQVLHQRFMLPVSKPETTNETLHPPHLGRPPSMTRVKLSHIGAGGEQSTFTLRPAYYDELDFEQNHVPNASLKMGQLSLRYRDNEISLDRLDLIDIHSVNIRATGLPGDDNGIWKLNVGWQRPTLGCDGCVVFGFRALTGNTIRLADDWFFSTYLGGDLYEGNGQFGNARLSAGLELQGIIAKNLNILASTKTFYYLHSKEASDEITEVNLRYKLSNEWDVRLHVAQQDENQVGISIGHYW